MLVNTSPTLHPLPLPFYLVFYMKQSEHLVTLITLVIIISALVCAAMVSTPAVVGEGAAAVRRVCVAAGAGGLCLCITPDIGQQLLEMLAEFWMPAQQPPMTLQPPISLSKQWVVPLADTHKRVSWEHQPRQASWAPAWSPP